MIEPQKVPSNYVQSTVSEDVADRLQAIQEEILSRAHLRKIISDYSLYGITPGKLPPDDVVDRMRRDIMVAVKPNQLNTERTKSVAAFEISFSGPKPDLVQQVTRNLASLFIEENLRDREQESEGTTNFLDDELEKLRESLQQQEQSIEAFKSAHAGELPEQQAPSLQMLGQLQSVLLANSDAITRAQQQSNYLASLLDSLKQMSTPQSMKSSLQLEYDNKTAALLDAEQKYKPNHPDVRRLKAELTALKREINEEKKKDEDTDGRDPNSPAQIQVEIAGLDKEVAKRSTRQVQLENEIKQLQERISALPRVEQELASLTRDYDTSQASYQALLSKRNNSSVAAEMERRAQGEQFLILDPASYPEKPYKPNLLQIDILGLVVGLFVGGALAMLVEKSDTTLHSENDLGFSTSLPVLATLPYVPDPDEKRAARMNRWWLLAGSCGSFCVVLLLAYLKRFAILTGFGWRF